MNIQGKVIVSFVVNSNGNVVDARVEKSVQANLDAEAIRIVMNSPKWTAGKQDGVAVNVRFTFPINFVLDAPEKSETIVVNNYNDYTHANYRSLFAFGYRYTPYCNYYDPYYYGGYYGYDYYPYWGHNRYYGRHYNNWNYGYYSKPRGKRYASRSTLGWNRNYYKPYNKTYGSGYVNAPTAAKKNVYKRPVTTRSSTTKVSANTTRKVNNGTRNFRANYTKPKMSTRPQYNDGSRKTRVTSTQPRTQKSTTVRAQKNMNQKPNNRSYSQSSRGSASYTKPNSTNRSGRSYRAPSRTVSKSYNTTSRSSSRSTGNISRTRSSSGSRTGGKK